MADPLDAIQKALRGETEHIVSYSGRSQYGSDGGGVSACGLAVLNCARLVLEQDKQGVHGIDLLQEMTKRAMFEDILDICVNWSNTAHLDVDDIYRAPIFSNSLNIKWSEFEQSGLQQFQDLLGRLHHTETGSAALVITRPPEIVGIIKIVVDDAPVFVTFDSHPRQKHPDGAALIIHPSLEAAASYLDDLLRFDPVLLADPALQWQAQLLAHYSAHMFVAKEVPTSPTDITDALIEASLEILALKAELTELKGKEGILESDNKQLSDENMRLEARVEDLEEDVKRHVRRATFLQTPAVASTVNGQANKTSVSDFGVASSSTSHLSSNLPQVSSSKGKLVFHVTDGEEDDELFATRIQLEWQEQTESDALLAYQQHRKYEEEDSDALLARQRQRKYEEEDKLLTAQFESLKQSTPANFCCGICLEESSEYMIAKIDGCGHNFCRSCILSYIRSKLAEHRFPIPCPTCAAEKDVSDPGTIDAILAQNVGLTEDEYTLFAELELAAFSVPLQCRKCQKAVFVDREEYDAQDIIVCPLPGCNHAWCKACSRTIEIGGPLHSCDGTSELNHLMDEQGWKRCPGCRTPTSKIEGCNHMTCISPGCNTHFCYLCAETIVQSVRREEIRRALSNHYARCQMIDDIFEVPRPR